MAQLQPEVMPVLCPRHVQPQLLMVVCAAEVAWLGGELYLFSYVFATKLPDGNNLQKDLFGLMVSEEISPSWTGKACRITAVRACGECEHVSVSVW